MSSLRPKPDFGRRSYIFKQVQGPPRGHPRPSRGQLVDVMGALQGQRRILDDKFAIKRLSVPSDIMGISMGAYKGKKPILHDCCTFWSLAI